MSIERGAPHFSRKFSSGNISVGHLSHGMNTGVRATGTMNLGSGTQNLLECCNQVVLHRITVRLALPTRKSSAVVGDGESHSFTGRNLLLHNAIKNVLWLRSWLRKLTAFIFLASPSLSGPDLIAWRPTLSYARWLNMIFPVSGI